MDGRDVEPERSDAARVDEALVEPGDEITIEGYKAKDGSHTANAARVTLADGRTVFAGSSGAPSGTPDASQNK